MMEAFDPYSPEIDADPFPYYQVLREQYPCYWSKSGQLWIISRYDDIVEAARDWQTFSSSQGNMIDELPGRAGATLGTTDPPRHDRLRALSVYGTSLGLAAVGGQLIGGALIALDPAGLGWRSCFLINVPVGVAALVMAPRVIPESRQPGAPLDLAELALRLDGDEYPQLDVEAYLGEIDAMAHEARPYLRGDLSAKIGGLIDHPSPPWW